MKFLNAATAAAIAVALPTVAVQAADVRPGMVSMPSISAPTGQLAMGTRVGQSSRKGQSLLGAPLIVYFLGAVFITIGTIIIVNNGNGTSPRAS